MEIKVQDGEKEFSIDLTKNICECNGGHDCKHLIKAKDIFLNQSKINKSELISFFHKSLRRNDVETAQNLGRIIAKSNGRSRVASYIKAIITEETFNIDLFLKSRQMGAADMETLIDLICRSRKFWELSDPWFYNNMLSYREQSERGKTYPLQNLEKEIFEGDYDHLSLLRYAAEFQNQENKFLDLLTIRCEELDKKTNFTLAPFVKKGFSDPNNAEFLLGYIGQKIGEEENSYHPSKAFTPSETYFITDYPNWIYDSHTVRGRQMLRIHKNDIKPGVPLPQNLCLAWSGGLQGIWWRLLAYRQWGAEMINKRWEDVAWTPYEWSSMLYMDQ